MSASVERKLTRVQKLGYKSYNEYLSSPRWQSRRAKYASSHSERCFVCETGSDLCLHHLTYDNLGSELDRDLIWLCRTHHTEIHKDGKVGLPRRKAHLEMRQRWLSKRKKSGATLHPQNTPPLPTPQSTLPQKIPAFVGVTILTRRQRREAKQKLERERRRLRCVQEAEMEQEHRKYLEQRAAVLKQEASLVKKFTKIAKILPPDRRPATPEQMSRIGSLGGDASYCLTRSEAEELIVELLSN